MSAGDNVVPMEARPFLEAAIAPLHLLTSACTTADRGHRFSDGHSYANFWMKPSPYETSHVEATWAKPPPAFVDAHLMDWETPTDVAKDCVLNPDAPEFVPERSPKRAKVFDEQASDRKADAGEVGLVGGRPILGRLLGMVPQASSTGPSGLSSDMVASTVDVHVVDCLNEEDISMIVAQTGCSHDDARRALREHGGDIVDAIAKLYSG